MSRLKLACCAAVVVAASSLAASAQVVYEPVQYQYWAGGRAYYYGGHDPRVHQRANQLSHEPGYGRTDGYAFQSGDVHTHREVTNEPARTYTDQIPHWNARYFGYTADDARNAAYANAATYFRKADLVRHARVQPDGTWSIPTHGVPARGTIDIRPVRPTATKPATDPKPVLIIPKRLLDKKLWPEPKTVADAR